MSRSATSGNSGLAPIGAIGLLAISLAGCSQQVVWRDAAPSMLAAGDSAELLFDSHVVQAAGAAQPGSSGWELSRNDHLWGARAEPTQAQVASYGDGAPCLDDVRRLTIQSRPDSLTYFRIGGVRWRTPACDPR